MNSKSALDREQGIDMNTHYLAPSLTDKLVGLALNDPVPGVAGRAALVLGMNGDSTLLHKYLHERKLFTTGPKAVERRRNVATVAYYLNSPESLPVLRSLVDDSDLEVRQTVYVGLSRSPDESAIDVLSLRLKREHDRAGSTALKYAIQQWNRLYTKRRDKEANRSMSR